MAARLHLYFPETKQPFGGVNGLIKIAGIERWQDMHKYEKNM